MRFIGRKQEIKAIEELIAEPGYRAGIVYGRRRLGKTELLKRCLINDDVPCLFFQCIQDSEDSNTLSFTKVLENALGLSHLHFDSFMEAVSFVFDAAKEREIRLVIDEYPYLKKLISGIDSKLQSIIDANSSESNLKFFLCGSSIAVMEDMQSESNPLFRRFHLSILLKEMDYLDSSEFYPSFSYEDKVRLYAAFGGVPFYNQQIDEKRTVKENIIRLLSGSYSYLIDEITVNLKEELAKVNNANAVFLAIAEGAFHYSDILSKSHINTSASLSDIIEKLLKMDLIEYIAPINDSKNKQKSGYRITDSSLRFYYCYLHMNQSAHAIADNDIFYDQFIKDDFEHSFVPKAFEKIATQYLIRQNRAGKLSPMLTNIGTYWYDCPKERRNGQFDVVAETAEGYIFYEVKFTGNPIDNRTIDEEIEQVNKSTLHPICYGFVSRSGFTLDKKDNCILICLKDLYAE